MMTVTLTGISSMATQAVLSHLTQRYTKHTGIAVNIQSVGGVDAVKRIQTGETFDMVLLASDAIDKLISSGHINLESKINWVHSPVAVAVPCGCTAPDISNAQFLKQAVLNASSISYSTGPSGNYLARLFESWGIAQHINSKLIVPPPGTSVASILAQGKAALGFQQLSELIHAPSITVVGQLPAEVAYITTFSAGIPTHIKAQRASAVNAFFAYLNSHTTIDIKHAQGLSPATLESDFAADFASNSASNPTNGLNN